MFYFMLKISIMKKGFLYSVYAIAALSAAGCSDALDINQDPRYPVEASTQALFSSALAWSSSRLGRDGQLVGEIWSQHYTQNNAANQYKDVDYYNLQSSNGYSSALWSSLYSGSLPDLRLAIGQAEQAGEWNYWLAAKVMTAFDFYLLACFFEKAPFTDALKGEEVLQPQYDDSRTIYAGIITILNEAIAKKSDAMRVPISMGGADFVFGGDVEQWVKFAKALKLKVLMLDFTANQRAIDTLLTDNDLLESKDAKVAVFRDAENYSNPLYEADRRKLNTNTNLRASATLVTYLRANSDPRIEAFFDKVVTTTFGSDVSNYRGLDQGSADAFTQTQFPTSAHSRATLAATDAVYFLSASDCLFAQAEAYARLEQAASAKSKYDAGVIAAFSRWSKDASAFIAAGGAYEFPLAATLDEQLKTILMQKWVSTTRCNSWEAFFDICRTGIPALGDQTVNDKDVPRNANANYVVGTLTPSLGSMLEKGEYPRRLLFPKTSADYNDNVPRVEDYPLTKKMWWHKQ
jgi:hypothetical protein